MHVFFQTDLSHDSIVLDEEESKHCTRVLRLRKEDEVHLADGNGLHAIGKITDDNPKKTNIQIHTKEKHQPNSNYHLHIAIAPTKNADRIEWFVEKATECGLNKISFIQTTNSERVKLNLDRIQKILVSAMKQSKQWFLPKTDKLVSLTEFLKNLPPVVDSENRFIAYCPTDKTALFAKEMHQTIAKSIMVLIGPEGDFTKSEIEAAIAKGFKPVSFGENILRTETAGLYAAMAVKTIFESK